MKHNFSYVNLKDLFNYSKDLICLGGGNFGFISKNYMNETINNTNQAIKTLKEIFKDDFFLEIQKLNKTNQELCYYLIKESDEQKIPLVATNENFF